MEPSVLVVEDDELVRNVLCTWLRSCAYTVTEVADGIEALAIFNPGQFGAVITDYNMTHLDGIELIKILKEYEPGLPALLTTSGANDLAVLDLIRYPRFAALRKPYPLRTLEQALKRLMLMPHDPKTYHKRSAYRFSVDLDAQLNGHSTARVTSLSKNGCFVATDPRVGVGADLSVQFRNLTLHGKSVWVNNHKSTEDFPKGLGVQFNDLDSATSRNLQGLLVQEMRNRQVGWLE
jgi:two-component system chemotaxis response regulator CheY